VRRYLNHNLTKALTDVTCFGLAFNSAVVDLRESPAMEVPKQLAKTMI
jgi:UDP-N-acetyl-D-mannosaminuronate dehydrogenase